ncbi:MAG TPA: two-component regulator propeller domain-containing protein [Chryseosolibacter sp.]|nr:two-component regulator propeller domain-containing protein [Chryseosolibacter sp.]
MGTIRQPCALLTVICICFSIITSGGQPRDIKFSHITVDAGLPSNTVNSVVADSRGFIWIASENGVGRYDGYSFTTYRSRERDTLSISSNITYVVFEDGQQRVWVGSEGGVDLYDRNMDRFDKHFLAGMPVRAIFQDRQQRLWVGSDKGLYLLDESRESFSRVFPEMFDSGGVVYNTISSITEDHHGNLWIGTSGGAYVYHPDTRAFRHYFHDAARKGSLSANNVRKIAEDKRGRIWVATYGGGLNLMLPGSETFTIYQHRVSDHDGISSNLLPTLWINDDGKVWIGTDGKGIDIFDPETELFHHVVHAPHNSKSLNNNVVRSISSDRRGSVWVGTYNGGVNVFNQDTDGFFYYKVPTVNGNSSVTAFAEEKNGNLWIGTDGGGLCYFNRAAGTFVNYFHDQGNANSLSDNRVIALQLDASGILWVGTYLGGLCSYDPAKKIFRRYRKSDGSGLSDDVVWALLIDREKRLWVGTNRGLNLYDAKTGKFTSINITNSNLSNDMVRCLYEDQKQRLWIGTQEGLNILERPYRSFQVIKTDGHKENTLSNHWIRTITSDLKGHLWIGTFAGGLNLHDQVSGEFASFTEADGLPDNIVSGILVDDDDNLWISTGRGIGYMDVRQSTFKNYDASDGLQDSQYNINACFRTQRGEFLFGGNNGFTLFVPESIKRVRRNAFPPAIALTSFKIFNREVAPGSAGSPLKAHINETSQVSLSYDQNVITFEFSALNFIQPDKNQYAYRLDGFEDSWNFVGTKRSATYTNLEPGSYTFQVKASNNHAVWNELGRSVTLRILPPFWRTWWFKAAVAGTVLAIGLVILHILRNRIREKIRINKRIAELELKALIAQMNPHFIFNCLTSIQELIILHKQDEAMHYLNQFSRLLRTVLQSSEKNFVRLDEELTLISLYLELEAMRFNNQFHYHITVDKTIDPEELVIPSFLIQPIIENALWHGLMHKSGDRNLRISFTLQSNDVLKCTINDNGVGREHAATLDKRRTRSYQSLGIKIIRDRMELMKKQSDVFDLQIVDEKDQHGNAAGTTVNILLPIGFAERHMVGPAIHAKAVVAPIVES